MPHITLTRSQVNHCPCFLRYLYSLPTPGNNSDEKDRPSTFSIRNLSGLGCSHGKVFILSSLLMYQLTALGGVWFCSDLANLDPITTALGSLRGWLLSRCCLFDFNVVFQIRHAEAICGFLRTRSSVGGLLRHSRIWLDANGMSLTTSKSTGRP